MRRKGNFLRRSLFQLLPLEIYLWILSKLYFLSFNTGLLKNNRLYNYPYFLHNIINEGDVCIDIGANLGYYTVPLSKIIGPKGEIYAVEPVRPILSVLKKNTKNLQNVKIYPFALGKESGLIKLGNNTKREKGFVSSGTNFILDQKFSQATTAEVEFDSKMRKGSEVFSHLNKLSFIKCDIEGYETVVIPELKSIILKFKPILLIEARGGKRVKMLQFFKSRNFKAFVLCDDKLYPAKKDEYWDILFVPQNKLGKVSKYIA